MVEANVIVTVIGTSVLTVAGMIPALRKFVPVVTPVVQAVEKEAPAIMNAGKELLHSAEDLLKLPQLAEVKLQLDSSEKKLADSELLKVAGVALHAFEKPLSALTPNEQGTLFQFVRTSLAKVNVTVTDAQIVGALNDAQQLAEAFKSTAAFQNTAALEESLKALAQVTATSEQPAQPAPAQ